MNASTLEIKKAYKNLAKECHPDKNQGNENSKEKFLKIAKAYEILSDPKQKSKYDLTLTSLKSSLPSFEDLFPEGSPFDNFMNDKPIFDFYSFFKFENETRPKKGKNPIKTINEIIEVAYGSEVKIYANGDLQLNLKEGKNIIFEGSGKKTSFREGNICANEYSGIISLPKNNRVNLEIILKKGNAIKGTIMHNTTIKAESAKINLTLLSESKVRIKPDNKVTINNMRLIKSGLYVPMHLNNVGQTNKYLTLDTINSIITINYQTK